MEEAQLGGIIVIQERDGLVQDDSNEYILKVDPKKSKVWGLSNYKNIIALYRDEEDSESCRFGGRTFKKNWFGAC